MTQDWILFALNYGAFGLFAVLFWRHIRDTTSEQVKLLREMNGRVERVEDSLARIESDNRSPPQWYSGNRTQQDTAEN